MTIESRELASAKAYIESRGLTAPFEQFHQAREKARLEEAKPAFYIGRVERTDRFGRKDETANITPWLRVASAEDIQRFIDIEPENLSLEGEPDDDDTDFLDTIWWAQEESDYDSFDEEEDDWVRSYYGCFKIDLPKFKDVIKEVNPTAYRHLFISPEELGQAALPL